MPSRDIATLVHTVGYVTGVALYAMLAAMVVRTPATTLAAGHDRSPAAHIALATAALGLAWNVGGLILYAAPGAGLVTPGARLAAVTTLAFAALGFLPAVVVQAAVEDERPRWRLAFTSVAYLLSALAAAMHAAAAPDGTVPSRAALRLLSIGYAIILTALVLRLRRRPGARGPLAAAALAAFAVMAVHLGHHADVGEPLPAELIGHHASLALALVILYQDYRFALADLFLKRALAAVGLVGFALAAYLAVAPFVAARLAADPSDPRAVAALLTLWVVTAMVYPAVRRGVTAFVDRVVLRRADYGKLRAALAARVAALETPDAVLDATCEALVQALSAERVTWSAADLASLSELPAWADARREAIVVPVPTADAPAYTLTLGSLRAGRRLLSDDLAFLEAVGAAVGRRLDAMRMAQERGERAMREQEIGRLVTEAELRALRAQLNPHFLFNALTTVGHLLREAPDRALDTLLHLTGLLRAVLKPTAGELISLAEEMAIVEAYVAIEKARFEERMEVTIDVPDDVRALLVPPLVLQPLVENAVKHGVSPLRAGTRVLVWARIEPATTGDGALRLHLAVSDSGAGVAQAALARGRLRGVGLANVERRLERMYGSAASLAFQSAPGVGTSVDLWLPATDAAAAARSARRAS